MHGVNLDLLHLGPYHTDGRPKNPHAHHRAAHLTHLGAPRHAGWKAALSRLIALTGRPGSQMKARTAP